jgi:hypothetical protein
MAHRLRESIYAPVPGVGLRIDLLTTEQTPKSGEAGKGCGARYFTISFLGLIGRRLTPDIR